MNAAALWGAGLAAAAVTASTVWKVAGKRSGVVLTNAGYAGIVKKDGRLVGAFVSTGVRPHNIAGLTLRTCSWLCAASAREALRAKKESAQK